MAEYDISVIIVSFNTRDLLRNCIESLYDGIENLSCEIFVVDNASSDGSPEMVAKEFPEVKLIRNLQNAGFAKANNQALELSGGRHVLLLNSDTIVKPGAIEILTRFIDSKPEVAAVGPKVLNPDGTLQFKGFSFPSVLSSLLILFGAAKVLPYEKMCRLFPKLYWDENSCLPIDFVPGCCMLMRKKTIDVIGPLPENFFMYFEEAEWCYRAKKKSYEVWYVPTSEIIHFGSASPLDRRREMFTDSMILFYKRNIGLARGIPIAFFLFLAACIAFLRVSLWQNYPSEHLLIKSQMKEQAGLLKGLIGI